MQQEYRPARPKGRRLFIQLAARACIQLVVAIDLSLMERISAHAWIGKKCGAQWSRPQACKPAPRSVQGARVDHAVCEDHWRAPTVQIHLAHQRHAATPPSVEEPLVAIDARGGLSYEPHAESIAARLYAGGQRTAVHEPGPQRLRGVCGATQPVPVAQHAGDHTLRYSWRSPIQRARCAPTEGECSCTSLSATLRAASSRSTSVVRSAKRSIGTPL